jgi:hypothetical protein
VPTRHGASAARGSLWGALALARVMHHTRHVLNKLKAELREIKGYPPGERFSCFHERHKRSQSGWVRPVLLLAAAVSLVVGVILAFIPGPAILFFAITAALVATQNHAVAKQFDRAELAIRKLLRSLRDKRRRA